MSLMLCIPPPAPEVGGITAAYTMITISNIVYKFAVCMVCRHFASTKWHAPLSQIKVHSTHGQPSYFGIWGRKSNMRLSHSLTSSYASNRELITPRELSKLWSACVKQNVRSSSQWWLCFLAFWTLECCCQFQRGARQRKRGNQRQWQTQSNAWKAGEQHCAAPPIATECVGLPTKNAHLFLERVLMCIVQILNINKITYEDFLKNKHIVFFKI